MLTAYNNRRNIGQTGGQRAPRVTPQGGVFSCGGEIAKKKKDDDVVSFFLTLLKAPDSCPSFFFLLFTYMYTHVTLL